MNWEIINFYNNLTIIQDTKNNTALITRLLRAIYVRKAIISWTDSLDGLNEKCIQNSD
jgi:hypothetical protein